MHCLSSPGISLEALAYHTDRDTNATAKAAQLACRSVIRHLEDIRQSVTRTPEGRRSLVESWRERLTDLTFHPTLTLALRILSEARTFIPDLPWQPAGI